MLIKLQDIAQISTGVYEKGSFAGDTLYLQANHFDDLGEFRADFTVIPKVYFDEKLTRHLLIEGDVLLNAKGDRNKACLYKEEIGRAVASSTFFVVRLKGSNGVLPKYLQWILNTNQMQSQLSGLASGTQIRSISKKMLMELNVHIPPQKTQEQILNIQQLWIRERSLVLDVLEQKENLYQNLLMNLVKSNLEK